MSDHELVELSIKEYGFDFLAVRMPDDVIEDKLALASTETGLISRIEYQTFLFSECVLNVERIYLFMVDATGGDPEGQIVIRNKIEDMLYSINPAFNPIGLVITKSGVIKPSSKGEGTPLIDNSDWNNITGDINPYVVIDEIEIVDDPADIIPNANRDMNSIKGNSDDDFTISEVRWARLNVDIEIKKFSPIGATEIFKPGMFFEKEVHYKAFIVQSCLLKPEAVFMLLESLGLTEDKPNIEILEELYSLCISVNPSLKFEDMDLSKIAARNPPGRSKSRSRKRGEKEKKGSGKIFSDVSKEELLSLSGRMKKKVIGQEEAVDQIVETIQIASCGLRDPDKPVAVYLMCGSTGVGKTFLSKVLAEELCGSRDNLVRIDCSEYTQQHDVQKLIGAPPSYVGYEDGGFLTNAVQENPFSVVLFDEIEKAHSKLFDLLLQIMDDARLTDGKGNTTQFKDAVILLTSNIGVSEAESVKSTMGFGDGGLLTEGKRKEALKDALKKRFRPEFLNRIDSILSFNALSKDDMMQIIDLMLDKINEYLSSRKISAEFTEDVKQLVFEKGVSKKFGARPLQRTIEKEVIKPIAQMLLKEEIAEGTRIRVGYKNGNIVIKQLKKKAVASNPGAISKRI